MDTSQENLIVNSSVSPRVEQSNLLPVTSGSSPQTDERLAQAPSVANQQSARLGQQILQLARTRTGILIQGEPGVGKQYTASLIHAKSVQARFSTFVRISAQTSDEEIKVILFEEGRKRYEGMVRRSVVRLDAGSTLFVNHVHEFSLINQTRIARFLIQNNANGSSLEPRVQVILSTCIPWDVLLQKRLVVESLDEYVRQFQVLVIPPLRERRAEIPEIVGSILKHIPLARRGARFAVKQDVLDRLMNHPWHDNVRELRMVLEDAARSSKKGALVLPATFFDELERLQESISSLQKGKSIVLESILRSAECALVQRALMRSDFNPAKAAKLLRVSEQNIR
ncbi:MAG: sigma 54-interacting transcriptional regulator, partial [Terriglobia bacterium]